MLAVHETVNSLLRGIRNAKLRIWILFHELCAKSTRSIWNDVTDDETRVALLDVLLGEEVIGHLVSHSSKTNEACGMRPQNSSISSLQTSKSGPHVQLHRENEDKRALGVAT